MKASTFFIGLAAGSVAAPLQYYIQLPNQGMNYGHP